MWLSMCVNPNQIKAAKNAAAHGYHFSVMAVAAYVSCHTPDSSTSVAMSRKPHGHTLSLL